MQVTNQIKPKFSIGQRLVSNASGFNFFIKRIYFIDNALEYDVEVTKPYRLLKGFEKIAEMRWPQEMLINYLKF